jgi:hypothetical protein
MLFFYEKFNWAGRPTLIFSFIGHRFNMLFFFLIFRPRWNRLRIPLGKQDLQDYSGLFFNLSHFPDGSEKTQSAFSGKLISLVSTIYPGIFL